jgi:hypothetical protein
MRPNLMSPRRPTATSGEDSILAMLEREPAHRRKGGAGAATSGARLAWYGASAAVAMALTGALVWLAANNDGLGRDVQDTMLADAGKAAQRAAPPAPPVQAPALRPAALEVQPAGAALIVDQAPTPEGVPPLRLLKPAPAAPVASAPARPAAKPTPARPAPVATVEDRPTARPAPVAAKPKPALAANGAVRPAAPKSARPATPARTPEAPVDADVALISAVIVHANGHAPPGSQMTELLCPKDSCKSRPASE